MRQKLLTKGNEPEKWVVAKLCAEVHAETSIIWFASMEGVVFFTALFAEFNRCVLIADKVDMEAEEC